MAQGDEQVVVTLVIRADAKSAAEAQAKLKESAKELGVTLEDVTRKVEGQRSTYDKMMRSLDPVYAGMKRLEGAEKALAGEVERGRITLTQKTQALDLLRQKLDILPRTVNTATGAIRLQSFQVANLGQQFQDVAVQLAGGQNPFLIAMQQGPQAAYAVGGFANALTLVRQAIVANAVPLAIFAAGAAAVGVAMFLLRDRTEEARFAQEAYTEAVDKGALADVRATAATTALADARKKLGGNEELLRRAAAEAEGNLRFLRQQQLELQQRQALSETEGLNLPQAEFERQMQSFNVLIAVNERRLRELGGALAGVSNEYERLAGAQKMTAAQFADLETAMEQAHRGALFPDLKRGEEVMRGLARETDVFAEEARKLGIDLERGSITAADHARQMENLRNWLYQTSDAYAALRGEIAKAAKAAADLEDAQEAAHKGDVAADLKKRDEVLRALRQPMDSYVDRMRELNSLQAKGLLVGDDYARSVENLNNWLAEQDPAFQKARKAAEDYAKELERVVGRTTDRMVDFGADAFFDVLEGRRDDFWASMVTTAKRAFAQMAAEALLRPIFLPIVQGVVGSAPGLFGVQGNPLGSFAQGAAQSAGSSLLGGNNPLSSLFSGIRNFFSPDNFIASAFPSLFGSGISAGGMLASTLTGPGGMMLGGGVQSAAMLGAGPLAGLAPFLPALAIALPLLLSFFMGGKKSVGPNGNAIINFERDAEGRLTNPGGLAIGGLGADNGGDKEFARKMAEGATKAVNTIVDRIGGRMTGMPGAGVSGQLELGYFQEGGKFFSIVGGSKAEFGSAEEAVADFAKRTLQAATITGMSPDVQLALSRTIATSLEDLGKDIDFAHGFRRQVDLAAAGPGTRAEQMLGFRYAAQDNASQQRLALRDFVADARRLFGDDSTQLVDAKGAARNRALAMIGLGPDTEGENKPLEGMAAQVAQTREMFQALKETLVDTGLSAAEAQAKIEEGLKKTFRKIADDQDKAITDAILAAESPAAASAVALAESQKRRRADYIAAHTAGGSTIQDAALYRLDELEAAAAFAGLTVEQLGAVARQMALIGDASPGMLAALAAAQAAASAAERWAAALAEFVDGFGAMNVDLARWAYEAEQAQTTIADAEQEAADAKQVYIDALNREISTVTEQVAAIDEQIRAQEALKTNFERLALTMREARLGLLIDPNLSPLNPQDRLTEARSQFESIYARAQLGDTAAMEQLPGIGRSFLESSKAFNASNSAYFADFSRVQEALRNTETIAERQVRIADEQLVTLNGQRDVLTSQLDVLRAQLAEAEGQSDDIHTVAEAAALWREAERRAQNARDGTDGNAARIAGEQMGAFRSLAGNFVSLSASAATQAERDQIYQATAPQRDALLGSITDIETLQRIGQIYYQGDNRDSGAIFLRSRLYSLGAVPQFEQGGQHYGGLRLVGERGMELEATGPARYFSTDATVEMLRRSGPGANDGALLAAVRTMCQLLAEGNGISREAARAMVARLDDLVDGQGDHGGSLAEERARAA